MSRRAAPPQGGDQGGDFLRAKNTTRALIHLNACVTNESKVPHQNIIKETKLKVIMLFSAYSILTPSLNDLAVDKKRILLYNKYKRNELDMGESSR